MNSHNLEPEHGARKPAPSESRPSYSILTALIAVAIGLTWYWWQSPIITIIVVVALSVFVIKCVLPDVLAHSRTRRTSKEEEPSVQAITVAEDLATTRPVQTNLGNASLEGNVCSQQHEHDRIRLQTRLVEDGSLEIKWRFSKPVSSTSIHLFGYRNETGFAEYPFPKKDNGKLIVHTEQDGITYEFLKPGVEYFYTFLLTAWEDDWFSKLEERCKGTIRFKVTIPKEADFLGNAKKMKEFLGETVQIASHRNTLLRMAKTLPQETRSPVEQMIREADTELDIQRAWDEWNRKAKEAVNSLQISEDEKKEQMRRVEDIAYEVNQRFLQKK